jgi:hypothetical protein
VGTQYRSAIFYADPAQKQVAEAYIAQLDKAAVFPRRIVTRVDPLKGFYAAEAYHQDYLLNHPAQPYIAINDLPKVRNFERLLPQLYNAKPVTVASQPRRALVPESLDPQDPPAQNQAMSGAGAMMSANVSGDAPKDRRRHARARGRHGLAEFEAADARVVARQGGGARFLDLLVHQLPARLAVRQRVVPALQGLGPGDHRRAFAGVRVREGHRQRPPGDRKVRHPVPGGGRQQHGAVEGVQQSLLARALLRRRAGPHPRTSLR